MKVIQINSASHSFILKDFEKDIFKNWYAQISFQLKKFYPNLNIEAWTPEKNYKKEKIKKVKGVKFRIFPTNVSIRHSMEISFSMLKALKEEIKKADIKNEKLIIHFHEYHMWQVYLLLLLIKKNKNIKIIAQHHGARSPFKNLIKYKRLFLFFPLIILMQSCEKILFRKINIFYPLSDKEVYYLKKVAPNSKIKFQTMGISDEYFKKESKEYARKILKLEKETKYILYLGRIKTTKGIKELLDAFKEITDKKIKLLLIGEGVDFEKYKEYATKNNIKSARFLGPVYGKKKLFYLSACDALILPSHIEGAPVVIMEAVAKNLPVIATNVGGIPKMIKNNREGLIIPVNSKEKIIESIKEIIKWDKKNISKYAEKYRWERIIKNIIKDYGNI